MANASGLPDNPPMWVENEMDDLFDTTYFPRGALSNATGVGASVGASANPNSTATAGYGSPNVSTGLTFASPTRESRPAAQGAQARGDAFGENPARLSAPYLGNAASSMIPILNLARNTPPNLTVACPPTARYSQAPPTPARFPMQRPQSHIPVQHPPAWGSVSRPGPSPVDYQQFQSMGMGMGMPMGHPYLFNPAIALPTTLARWDVGSGLVSAQIGTGRGADLFPYPTFNFGATHAIRDASPPDSGPVPTSFVDGAASLAGSDYDCLSPAPTENRSRGQRASTVSTDITEPDPANSTPSTPLRQSIASKPTPASFEVIAYDPTAEGKGKRSRKRSADDEVAAAVRAPSRTLMEVQKKGENGELQGAMITFGSRPNKRTAFSENKRRETAIARKDGVCDRCKKSKRKCDLSLKMSPYESCTLCLCTRTYKGVPRMPCSQSAIKEVVFFRKGPAPNEPLFTSRRILFDLRDISKPNVAVKTLELTQKPGRHGPSLTVYASEFSPLPEDVISYKWKDTSGKAREMTMPLFCLTNLDKVTKQFRQYIEVANRSYMDALRTEDKLAWETFSMAMNHSEKKPKSLVSIALDLWAISRMIETPWQMCGSDTLGVSRINDPTNPHDGAIPIPPIMDTQLDQIVIQNVLLPLRNELVSKFDNMTAPPKPEDWFEIYLTAFILLNHIARLAKHSVAHAKLHTMPTKYSNKEFLEGAFHTAKIILARFHFVCNGSAPLRLNWKLPTTCAMANLEPDQVAFMETTQAAIRSRENDLRHLLPTHEYENPLYWSHQLFFKEWDKSPACVVEAY